MKIFQRKLFRRKSFCDQHYFSMKMFQVNLTSRKWFCDQIIFFAKNCSRKTVLEELIFRTIFFFFDWNFLAEKRQIIVSNTEEVTKNHPAIIVLVLRRDSWHSVLSSKIHVEVFSQNVVASAIADPYCCCESVYRLGAVSTHHRCNLLDLASSSNCSLPTNMHIILQKKITAT